MNIDEAKLIRLVDYMRSLGYEPTKVRCGHYWYISPFRNERTASFRVNDRNNTWYDFGEAEGGDIINLGKRLLNTNSTSEVLAMIERHTTGREPMRIKHYSFPQPPVEDTFSDVVVLPLTHYALLSYIRSRLINLDCAKKHCNEIHYKQHRRSYFGIAFGNRSGGYEIRNAYFKGCYKTKDITLIHKRDGIRQDHICVFEGFMDFLSYLTLECFENKVICINAETDYMILNSVNNTKKCLEEVAKYSYIHCYLDNDTAGQKTVETIRGLYNEHVFDESVRYQEYKDVNDYLQGKKR